MSFISLFVTFINLLLSRQQEAERAAAEKAAKKASIDAQLAKEEEEMKHLKKLRGQEKVAARKAQAVEHHSTALERFKEPALQARNITDAIAVLSIATGHEDNTSESTVAAFRSSSIPSDGPNNNSSTTTTIVGDLAAADDKNPEKRMKAAYTRYKEREIPILRKENPSLRLSQIEEICFKNWQKSPENPLVAAERAKLNSSSAWKDDSNV